MDSGRHLVLYTNSLVKTVALRIALIAILAISAVAQDTPSAKPVSPTADFVDVAAKVGSR